MVDYSDDLLSEERSSLTERGPVRDQEPTSEPFRQMKRSTAIVCVITGNIATVFAFSFATAVFEP